MNKKQLTETGQTDKYGKVIEDREYNDADFDRNLILETRTELVAAKVTEFLKATDRFAKTIIFCENIDHAERMRQAMVNANPDLAAANNKYVMRITGDNDEGKAQLDNFIDPESTYPVIACTSRLMSTGVDAQTCHLIVLDRRIASMTEFKQIIGRGTRINEDYNKLFFTIMDFKRATAQFADPNFDADPVQVYEPGPDETPVPPDDLPEDGDGVDAADDPGIVDPFIGTGTSGSGPTKYYVNAEVRNLIQSARRGVASVVDTFQVMTNFEIGRRIVEHEQKGEKRAGYGKELLKGLSTRLTEEFGRGYSEDNLALMRRFFRVFTDRLQISETLSRKLGNPGKQQTPFGELIPARISETLSRKSPFTLSWSHYVELLGIKDPDERSFYEIEAANENWSLSELKRQKASALYQRLALSRDKAGVKRLAEKGQIITKPEDVLKNPLVLEFLGLDEQAGYSESDLESAIITHLEKFLLELGKGFLFEARQKRFTFDGDHYFLDLVFYNRFLRCYLVIDLKLDKLTHQDLGQMQMYVNYYDRHVKLPEENPTIGLLLCREKNDAVVELTLPKDANIHAKEYQLYLPAKELLKAKLLEWAEQESMKGEG